MRRKILILLGMLCLQGSTAIFVPARDLPRGIYAPEPEVNATSKQNDREHYVFGATKSLKLDSYTYELVGNRIRISAPDIKQRWIQPKAIPEAGIYGYKKRLYYFNDANLWTIDLSNGKDDIAATCDSTKIGFFVIGIEDSVYLHCDKKLTKFSAANGRQVWQVNSYEMRYGAHDSRYIYADYVVSEPTMQESFITIVIEQKSAAMGVFSDYILNLGKNDDLVYSTKPFAEFDRYWLKTAKTSFSSLPSSTPPDNLTQKSTVLFEGHIGPRQGCSETTEGWAITPTRTGIKPEAGIYWFGVEDSCGKYLVGFDKTLSRVVKKAEVKFLGDFIQDKLDKRVLTYDTFDNYGQYQNRGATSISTQYLIIMRQYPQLDLFAKPLREWRLSAGPRPKCRPANDPMILKWSQLWEVTPTHYWFKNMDSCGLYKVGFDKSFSKPPIFVALKSE